MSKVVKTVVGITLAVVGFATGNPALAIQGAAMAFSAITEKSTKAKTTSNAATEQRLSKRLEPESFRKIVFGKTAGGADMRYWEVFGSTGTSYDEVIAVAGHKVHSFQELSFEDDLAFAAGASTASSPYNGSVTRITNTAGASGAGTPLGGAGVWTANASMTGIAYYILRWTYDQAKLPNGIPSRYTQVVEGALVYDPRRDSTRGGSGSHRADDQSTWSYSTLDSNGVPIGRNNALQVLWYEIGWRVNGKLVCGRGVDLNDIDFASFITAANDCEVEQYYSDCILSTGDSHATNESVLCSAAGGKILDTGGRFSYRVAIDDTASVAQYFDENDIVSAVTWVPRDSMSAQFNQIAGTFVDPAALYQSRPFPAVLNTSYETADGFKRRKSQALSAVQDAGLAQRLMRIELNKSRFQGVFRATFTYKAMRVKNWDCVRLTFTEFGWANKLFRVESQSISPLGGIELTLREEDPSVYNDGTVTTLPPPSAGYSYNGFQKIPVSSLTATATGVAGSGGGATDAMRLSWTAAPGNVKSTEIRYKKTGATDYMGGGTVNPDRNVVVIEPLQPTTNYTFEVRHNSTNDVPGDWVVVTQTTNAVTKLPNGTIVYSDGTPVDTLRPAEAGANVTGTNTAAGILGQAWAATNGSETLTANYLVPVGQNAYVNSEANGAVHNGTVPFNWAAANDGNSGLTVTRQGFVGARRGGKAYINGTPANGTFFDAFITPYGPLPLVRRFAMPCKPGDKIGFSMLLALQNATQAYTNVQFLDATGAYITEYAGNSITNNVNGDTAVAAGFGTSAAIVTAPANAAWAILFTRIICSGAFFPAVWCMSPMICILPAGTTVLPAYSPGPPDRSADTTSENTAAAFVGQSAWATYSGSVQSVTQPKVNQVFDGGLKLGAKGWGLFGFGYDNNATYGPLLFNGAPSSSAQSDFFKMSPSTQYTASANLGGAFAVNQAVMYIQFYNAAKAPLGNSGGIYFLSGVGFPRLTHTYTTPSDAAFGKLIIATGSGSVTQVIAFRLKNEFGAEASPFSDEATNSALYSNGVDIDSLRPAEVGANVTGTNTAAAIAGQGPGATAAADAVLNANVLAAGPNIVRWSSFERGLENINAGYQPTALSVGIGDAATEYAYASFSAASTPSAGSAWGSLLFGHPFLSWQQPYQLQGGRRYVIAVRGRAAGGPATRALPRINLWDINRSAVSATYVVSDAVANFGGFDYHYCIIDAPVSATMCSLEVYSEKSAGSTAAAFYAFDRPMIRQILSQSTAFPGYVNGPNAVAGADPTGQNTAAAIVGQASWATSTVPESRVSKLKNNGRSTNSYQVSNGVLTGATLYRSPVYVLGSSDVSGAARISIAASTLKGSGITVSYAAGTIDGCAYSTTYYVWIYDADVVGGTVTYVATTDPNAYIGNADYLYVGNIRTLGAGGTAPPPYTPPPTPPGYYDCVAATAWLPNQIRARDLKEGDSVLMLREDGEGSEIGKCTANKTALAPCMRFETVSGIELTCSTTTPILYKKEIGYGAKPAWSCDGSEIVPVLDAKGFRWEALASQPGHIGSLLVSHISVNDGVYAAGDQRDRYIFTHNIRMDEYVKP